jgi:dienelactone hydrolase
MPEERDVKPQKRIEAKVKSLQLSICLLAAFWLSACATMGVANAPDELARTLDEAIVGIPARYLKWDVPSGMATYGPMKYVAQDLAKIAGDKKIPLVIYLHGCAGFGYSSSHDINFLILNGYAVLAPNSFAREYKPESCYPRTYRGGLHRGVLGFRLAEAAHAHEAAKNLPWVDKKNIFMMGFSEGGVTTAKYPNGGLAGRIILGWTCNSGWAEYSGISGPRDEPILAIVASNDPWFRNPWNAGNCGNSMFFRRNAKSIVVHAGIHHVSRLPEVQEKILQFLALNRRL